MVTLRLPYRPPYDWDAAVRFFGPRAIPGVEWAGCGHYWRTIEVDGLTGVLEVGHDETRQCLTVRVHGPAAGQVPPELPSRLGVMLDLDADVRPIIASLAADPLLGESVRVHPGLRVPGAWDGFELAVRAILGQRVSVAAATTVAGRLVRAYGETLKADCGWPGPDRPHLFPHPEVLAEADLRALGLPATRARAVSALAAGLLTDTALLSPQDTGTAVARLTAVPGIGPWTAQYVAMRALRDADAFPNSDLGLRQSAAGRQDTLPTPAELAQRAEAWRPWRAYAAMHLWTRLSDARAGRQRMGSGQT